MVEPLRPQEPRRLGEYALTGRLGEGGQGVVYLGEDADGRQVAVKLLQARFSEDPRARAYFERELAAAQKVDPFCTARVLAADVAGSPPYIVSEFIPGPSLRDAVAAEGPRSDDALVRLAIGTATALTAIHQAGIVHRDFKPGNVIMGPDGPRVIDFGIARALEEGGSGTQTAVGTPAYMAPEQLRGEQVTPATDLFAWGCVVVFAATGRAPFTGTSVASIMHNVLNGRPDLTGLSGPLLDLAAACLDKDPARRPTARQVLLRLLGHDDLPAAASTVAPVGAVTTAPPLDGTVPPLDGTVPPLDGGGVSPYESYSGTTVPPYDATAMPVYAPPPMPGPAPAPYHPAPPPYVPVQQAYAAPGRRSPLLAAGLAATAVLVIAAIAVVAVRLLPSGTSGTGTSGTPGSSGSTGPATSQRTTPGATAPASNVTWLQNRIGLVFPPGWKAFTAQANSAGVHIVVEGTCSDPYDFFRANCSGFWVFGANQIARGAEGFGSYTGKNMYYPASDVEPCPYPASGFQTGSPTRMVNRTVEATGGHSAQYSEWNGTCQVDKTKDIYDFTQREWYFSKEQILIVDDVGIDDLPNLIANSSWR